MDDVAALDPRLHAVRPDLADRRLEGRVAAGRFVEGRLARIGWPVAPVRKRPAPDAPLETEALLGEAARVFEEDAEGWSWVQLETDGYVGYVPSAALEEPGATPTHRVSAPYTLLFAAPDIKSRPLHRLPMGAALALGEAAEDRNARYRRAEGLGFVVEQHVEPLDAAAPDFVAVAERFLGAPYLWGGKSWLGIDCTGLVQVALAMAGRKAPRDSDLQRAALGSEAPEDEPLRRGDLVFWPGHVGIMMGGTALLHANAHHMMTAVEPLAEAVRRIGGRGVPVAAVRRFDI